MLLPFGCWVQRTSNLAWLSGPAAPRAISHPLAGVCCTQCEVVTVRARAQFCRVSAVFGAGCDSK